MNEHESAGAPPSPEDLLAGWGAEDLSVDADGSRRAHAVDALVERVAGVLSAGRGVVLSGEPGVGKTAVVRELAASRVREGDATRIVKLSLQARQAKLGPDVPISTVFEELVRALTALPHPVVPFFEDGDAVRSTDSGESVVALAQRLGRPVILEGTPGAMASLLEDEPSLGETFVLVPVEEPDLDATRTIVTGWAETMRDELPRELAAEAVEEALYLGHRFLSRARFPRKAIELLTQTAYVADGPVDANAVLDRFCDVHKTPRWLVDPREPLDIDELEQRFQEQLLGQSDALRATLSVVSMMKTGLSDLRRPFGAFLFVGPTGVGKTHLAQLIAETLFGARDNLIRINMGDYAEDPFGQGLFGIPGHYILSLRRGALTQALLGRPFAVLLLDEIEKAHPALFDRLLPLMDEGFFENGAGERITCRSMIIIATSNAGAEIYRGAGLGFASEQNVAEKRARVDKAIRDTFRYEFLNRFDSVVHFTPLTREDTRIIARRELESLGDRVGFRRYGLQLAVDEAVVDWLAVHGYHPDFGARFLRRTIERTATKALSDLIVRRRPASGSRLQLFIRANRVQARVEAAPPPAGPAPRRVAPAAEARTTDPDALARRCREQLTTLEQLEAERSELLQRMNDAALWTDPDARERTLESFREVDVRAGIERRFARPIEAFLAAYDSPDFATASNARSLVGQAAASLARWEERRRLEGPRRILLVLSAVDAHRPPTSWMVELVRMYQQYCRRCDLHAQTEAAEPHANGFRRFVLEVEGPGCEHFLAAESGLHRLRSAGSPDRQVRVDLVRREPELRPAVPTRSRPPRETPLGFELEAEATLEVPGLGISTPIWGREPSVLADLTADLAAALPDWDTDPPLVRVHGETGGAVRDPRTEVVVPARAVNKGRLDPFCEAFHGR